MSQKYRRRKKPATKSGVNWRKIYTPEDIADHFAQPMDTMPSPTASAQGELDFLGDRP